MWTHNITRQQCIYYCTYLNSGLLEAPREYVLHGLIPGLNWASYWPLPMSMHLVATPSPVSCCLLQQVKFHNYRFLLSGWLLTNVQVNITTTIHDTWHTCIYITSALLFISSFYTSSILLGRLADPDPSRRLHYLYCISGQKARVGSATGEREFLPNRQKFALVKGLSREI
jgi:hypothetical protein